MRSRCSLIGPPQRNKHFQRCHGRESRGRAGKPTWGPRQQAAIHLFHINNINIELGASAREVIGMLAKRAAARTSAGLTPTSAAVARETRIIMGELGIGVMRTQAAQILSYVDGTPHAAMAKILGRGAVHRNLCRRVPAKLCVCSAMTCANPGRILGKRRRASSQQDRLRPYRPGSRARHLHRRRQGNSPRTRRSRGQCYVT